MDIPRLVEQLIPAIIMGGIVIFANFKVTASQVDDLRQVMRDDQIVNARQQEQLQAQGEKLASITAQITTFLGQQVQINQAIDARMTYIERTRSEARYNSNNLNPYPNNNNNNYPPIK